MIRIFRGLGTDPQPSNSTSKGRENPVASYIKLSIVSESDNLRCNYTKEGLICPRKATSIVLWREGISSYYCSDHVEQILSEFGEPETKLWVKEAFYRARDSLNKNR